MKKTIKINLSGTIFHIDEDAYESLKRYLDAIASHFSNKTEGDEILRDIESRIAELFQEKKPRDVEVVNLALVNEVIEIMGNPKDIADTGEENASGHKQSSNSFSDGTYYTGSRKLYRDPESSVIGGVCGGLGAYFNIDPLIFRILFIVFFFAGGSSFLVYIILWIVLPQAVTAAQKLEMRGEPVNVSNIEKKVKEEYENTKENVKSAVNSEQAQRTKKAASNFFSDLGKILLVFIKVILILIGTSFVIAGIGIIIALISGTFVGLHVFPFNDYSFTLGDLLAPFSDPVNITMLIIAISLILLIPIVAMIYGLTKIIFNIKSHNKGLTVGAVSLWVVSLLMIIGIFAIETGNYSDNGRKTIENKLPLESDSLYVSLNPNQEREFDDDLVIDLDLDTDWHLTKDLDRIYGEIDLDIEKSDNSSFYIEIEKKSKGKSRDDAKENAERIKYNFKLEGNNLVLDPYFYIDSDEKWRFPNTEITLKIPEGKMLILEKDTREVLEDVYNTNHISDWKMGGRSWIMTEEGLTVINE